MSGVAVGFRRHVSHIGYVSHIRHLSHIRYWSYFNWEIIYP